MLPTTTIMLLAAAFLMLSTKLLRAQAPFLTRILDSATVVRLHFRDDGLGEGRLLAPLGPSSTSVRYCPVLTPRCRPGQETVVGAAALSQVDVQSGTRTVRGFLIGIVVVSVVVVPIVEIGGSFTPGETRGRLLAKGFLLSALFGGGLGALIGRSQRTWEPVH